MATATITPISQPRSAGLLQECATLARPQIAHALDEVLTKTDDVLFKLANSADTSNRQNLFFDAMRELRLKRETVARNFADSFDRNLATAQERAQARERHSVSRADDLASEGELSLLELDEVEENLAIANFCETMKSRCGRELYALDQRMAVVLKVARLDDELNPFGPKAIGNQLKRALAVLESGPEVRLTLYKMLDKTAGAALLQLYVEINQRLAAAGILPVLAKPTVPHAATHRTRVTIESESDSLEASGEDVFSTLQQLIEGGRQGSAGGPAFMRGGMQGGSGVPTILNVGGTVPGSGSGGVPGLGGMGSGAGGPGAFSGFGAGTGEPGSFGGMPSSGGTGGGFVSLPMLVESLTALQRNNAVGGNMPPNGDTDAGPGPAAAGSGADGQSNSNVVRALRASGAIGNVAPTQDLTLEIVSLLIDHILEDRSIPDAIKALIGRLQIPLLKVALLDKDLFSRRSHPARRLLDALAAAAVGWYDGLPKSDRLYDKMEEVVQRIATDFVDDVGLFVEVLEDFEAFIAAEDSAAETRAEASSRSLRTREQLVLAKMEVDSALRARLEGFEVRDFVHQFLQDYWRQLLIITHVEAGPDSEKWAAQLGTVDELVWSVQPKATRDDRKAMSARLPSLLKEIKAGMLELEMEPAVCSKFLSMLASVHVTSIKSIEESSIAARRVARDELAHAGDVAAEPVTAKDPSASEEFIKQGLARLFERKAGDAAPLDIDFSTFEDPDKTVPDGRLDTVDPELAPFVDKVMSLDPGDWVEFDSGDGAKTRARFTWISEASGRYLFTNRQGERMLESTLLDLAREFQAGGADIIKAEADPLFDRILANVIDQLEGAAA